MQVSPETKKAVVLTVATYVVSDVLSQLAKEAYWGVKSKVMMAYWARQERKMLEPFEKVEPVEDSGTVRLTDPPDAPTFVAD